MPQATETRRRPLPLQPVGLNLSLRNLTAANLVGANLIRANLTGTVLARAKSARRLHRLLPGRG